MHEGPRHRHPLLLTTGELVGSVAGALLEPHRSQGRGHSFPSRPPSHPQQAQADLDVLRRRQQR